MSPAAVPELATRLLPLLRLLRLPVGRLRAHFEQMLRAQDVALTLCALRLADDLPDVFEGSWGALVDQVGAGYMG